MSSIQPGWVDAIAKEKPQRSKDQVQRVDTDPPLWEYLRRNGKKPFATSQAQYAQARSRGGTKGAKSKAARGRIQKLDVEES